jgi:hypothetical protein
MVDTSVPLWIEMDCVQGINLKPFFTQLLFGLRGFGLLTHCLFIVTKDKPYCSRYYVTHDDRILLSSEVGVLPNLPESIVKKKSRLEPGKMFLVDFEKGS